MTSQFDTDREQSAPLPEHWEMRVDSRTGMPYYLNHRDQFTTWDDPRLVSHPRGMLNTMGTMLRRSASPTPASGRTRRQEEERNPTSIPFTHHFLSPLEADNRNFDHFSQSLPRPHRFKPSPMFGQKMLNDDSWCRVVSDEPEDSFFDEMSWPIKAHTLRLRQSSPFVADKVRRSPPFRAGLSEERGRSSPCRRRSPENLQVSDDGEVAIPIRNEPPQPKKAEQNGGSGEHIIIPTQYKEKTDHHVDVQDKDVRSEMSPKVMRESPRPKLAKQEDDFDHVRGAGDDSHEEAVLQRMNSVYDNANLSSSDEEITPDTNDTPYPDCDKADFTRKTVQGGTSAEDTSHESEAVDMASTDNTDGRKDNSVESVITNSSDDEDGQTLLKRNIEKSHESIEKVRAEVEDYKKAAEAFNSNRQSKEFRFLEEMLTRCQLSLDDVSTHGEIELRKKRKETVNYIDSVLLLLEDRCSS